MKAYFEFTANPPGTLLQNAYTKQALAMLEARQTLIGGLHTAAAWKQRQEEVHHLFMDTMFHPLQDFERTPLNPRITKEYHDPRGFTVTMLTLEVCSFWKGLQDLSSHIPTRSIFLFYLLFATHRPSPSTT